MPRDEPLKVLVVDDERLARVRLRALLANYPELQVVAEADGAEAAALAIERHDPDVVFLDVQMPGEDGFGVFERVDVRAHVVFVTAHRKHAVRAFDVRALDYVLKPVLRGRLDAAVARILDAPRRRPGKERPLLLRTSERVHVARVRDVVCVDAADDYTEVSLSDGTTHLVRVTLSEWERRLAADGFVRVHRSALVDVHSIASLDRPSLEVRVRRGEFDRLVRVGRRRLSYVERALDALEGSRPGE